MQEATCEPPSECWRKSADRKPPWHCCHKKQRNRLHLSPGNWLLLRVTWTQPRETRQPGGPEPWCGSAAPVPHGGHPLLPWASRAVSDGRAVGPRHFMTSQALRARLIAWDVHTSTRLVPLSKCGQAAEVSPASETCRASTGWGRVQRARELGKSPREKAGWDMGTVATAQGGLQPRVWSGWDRRTLGLTPTSSTQESKHSGCRGWESPGAATSPRVQQDALCTPRGGACVLTGVWVGSPGWTVLVGREAGSLGRVGSGVGGQGSQHLCVQCEQEHVAAWCLVWVSVCYTHPVCTQSAPGMESGLWGGQLVTVPRQLQRQAQRIWARGGAGIPGGGGWGREPEGCGRPALP